MITIFTIFTIFSGVASLLGFGYIFFGSVTASYKRLCAWCLILAAIWSGYVALVPGSAVERNVAAKIAFYQVPSGATANDVLLVQSGEVSLVGYRPIGVQFSVPFRETPKIEVVNFKGYDPGGVPLVEAVTPFMVEFGRQSRAGTGYRPPLEAQVYRWIATGSPLKETSKVFR